MTSLQAARSFIESLKSSGGTFHESLDVDWDEHRGTFIIAIGNIEPDATLISVPFDKAITVESGRHTLTDIDGVNAAHIEGWNEHPSKARPSAVLCKRDYAMLIVRNSSSELHTKYIDALPSPESLRTPLFWTEVERALLQGTNLAGTVRDQEAERRLEYGKIKEVIPGSTWEQYIAATAYISSRAFPSRLLSISKGQFTDADRVTAEARDGNDDEEEGGGSYPVLIPGLDLFNHSRGTPITWLSSPIPGPSGSTPSVSFQTPQAISAGNEVFNNYGPKSNEEFLLSYGFVLDDNPDDTLILRLGAPDDLAEKLKASELDVRQRFVLHRDGQVPQDLLKVMRGMMGGHSHSPGCGHDHGNEGEDEEEDEHAAYEGEMEEMQLEMDVLGTIGGMLEDKLVKLSEEVSAEGNVRDDIRRMCEVYRRGQVEIIQKTQDVLQSRIERLEGMVNQGMGGCPCGC